MIPMTATIKMMQRRDNGFPTKAFRSSVKESILEGVKLRRVLIMNAANGGELITQVIASKLTGAKKSTAQNDLNFLVKQGLLRKEKVQELKAGFTVILNKYFVN